MFDERGFKPGFEIGKYSRNLPIRLESNKVII